MRVDPRSTGLLPVQGGEAVTTTRQTGEFETKMEQAAAKIETTQPKSTVPASGKGGEDPKLRAACQGMEAVFLNLLLSQMRATVPKSTLLGSSSQEEIIRSMLDTEMTKNMSQAGGIGLADMLYRQLSNQSHSTAKIKPPTTEG